MMKSRLAASVMMAQNRRAAKTSTKPRAPRRPDETSEVQTTSREALDVDDDGYNDSYSSYSGSVDTEVHIKTSRSGSEHAPPVPSGSLISRIGRGIGSLWSTRVIEDSDDSDIKIKTTLRELIIYAVYLILLCVLTFGMTSSTMYYYTTAMNNIFISGGDPAWTDLGSVDDLWSYLEGPLLDSAYEQQWYNGQNYSDDEMGYVMHENKMLGAIRLRQLRVSNDSCIIPDDFKDSIVACYDGYYSGVEDKEPFGLGNGTAWTYKKAGLLDGVGSGYGGLVASYPGGGGYMQVLPNSKDEATEVIQTLKDNLWIDRGTRAIFIDFTLYNANINLFCVMRLVAELPPTGGVVPSYAQKTVKLIRYVTPMDYFVLACEVMFVMFVLYYCIEEFIEIKKVRLAYFKNFWNILDVVVLLIAICCIVFSLYRTSSVNGKLESLLTKPDDYADFSALSYYQITYNSALALMVFCSWVKVFKYISFNKTMTQLSSTLSKCAKDLGGFAVMFFIFFLAFAQLGYLLFGTQIDTYSSVSQAILTLFRLILGDFDFDALQSANRILGPAFFVLYVFFVFFILLNMFLAIINDSYAEVKSDLAEQENEFEMGDYFRKGANKMLEKLNIKRDKIMDIQSAMQNGDLNNDGILDFDEWRLNMKQRGYADAEIEAVFAKYDVDGDRGLSSDEQKRMQKDLDSQQAELDAEIDKTKSDGDDQACSSEELAAVQQRVCYVEKSMGGLASKVEAVLAKLEMIERAKAKRRDNLGRLLECVTETGAVPDESQRQQMLHLVRDELLADCEQLEQPAVSQRPRSARSRPVSGQE